MHREQRGSPISQARLALAQLMHDFLRSGRMPAAVGASPRVAIRRPALRAAGSEPATRGCLSYARGCRGVLGPEVGGRVPQAVKVVSIRGCCCCCCVCMAVERLQTAVGIQSPGRIRHSPAAAPTRNGGGRPAAPRARICLPSRDFSEKNAVGRRRPLISDVTLGAASRLLRINLMK